jgi:hypothetical protein
MYEQRNGVIGNVRVAAVKPGTSPDTCIVGENLYKLAEKVYDNEYGPVDVSLVMLLDSQQKRLGVIRHRIDEAGMEAICREVVAGLRRPGGPLSQQVQTPERRLIIPGR